MKGTTLKLVGDAQALTTCEHCNGLGKIKAEDFMIGDGRWVRGNGWLPCPICLGKKVVNK